MLHSIGNGMKHALVIGGTGMLRDATLQLAEQFELVTVIARNSFRLNDLWESAEEMGLRVNPVQCDYKEDDHLKIALEETIKGVGPFHTVVAYIKSNAEDAPRIIGQVLNEQGNEVQYFDLLGNLEYEDFDVDEDEREPIFEHFPNIQYKQIILSAKDNGEWLHTDEITKGVLQAIAEGKDVFHINPEDEV